MSKSGRLHAVSGKIPVHQIIAVVGTVGLLGSFLSVLYDIVETVGDPLLFYVVVFTTLVAATLLSRTLPVTGAVVVGAILLGAGTVWHALTLEADLEFWLLVNNNIELLTGETVLQIQQVDVWALTVTPAPVFLTWYFVLRGRYVGTVVAGGSMLTYLVLTGDAGTTVTQLGVVSAGAVIGFGEIEATGWTGATDQTVVVLAVMVLVPLVITVVPGGAATPITFINDETETVEESVITETSMDIVGEVKLSPESRFAVTSDQPRLWRVGSYDRYTGDGWVKTGDTSPLGNKTLDGPPGPTQELTQTIEAQTTLSVLPTAWQPVSVGESVTGDIVVGPNGGFEIDGTVSEGTIINLTSKLPDPEREALVTAGQNYPESVREQYAQLPQSTPDRIGERTEQIARNAESPFETAVAVEQWLEQNREYSLTIDRPEGDIADAFLFEMDAGYCTYFATTMATMLRSQNIPTRIATGYTPGERVSENQYEVRGLNSHVWVEVYFPDIGWVEFDPTPTGPRQSTEQAALSTSLGANGGGTVTGTTSGATTNRAGGIGDVTDTGVQDVSDRISGEAAEQPVENGALRPGVGTGSGTEGNSDDGFSVPQPSRQQVVVSLVVLAGAVAWTRQTGIAESLFGRVLVRFQRRSDPVTDIERAYDRVLLLLEDRYRPRETGETVRQYLDDIAADEDVRRVIRLYEQAQYAEDASKADADEAVSLVDTIRKQE
ncbi:DUF3488 and DUF4129 domain-containing transglutaminase family protein [Halovenus rubra]|uniref:DUF3488 and DUF4129 domain-containing transglutaminase family protein n=2 Tax=Halovenus rubra TaxID=869890 RepID=A0ABD5X888_9EURY|nr:transglutaminase domain-containing protein [Halovenus rubra]